MSKPLSFDTVLSAGESLCQVSVAASFISGAPWNSYRHTHRAYELMFAQSGLYVVDFGDERAALSAGQILIVAPGVVHATHTPEGVSANMVKTSLTLRFTENPAPVGESAQLREWARVKTFFGGIRKYRLLENGQGAFSSIDALREELSGERWSVLRIHSLLLSIFTGLMGSVPSSPVEDEKPGTLDERRSAMLSDYFDFQVVKHRPGEEALASQLGISRRHLNRIVRKTYGHSFREQLLINRLEAAAFLLEYSALSLREISEQLGYESYSGFFVAYRKYYNTPPTLGRGRPRRSHQ